MIATVILVTLISYSILGYIIGFALAAHKDILNGVRPESNNILIMFLGRPTNEIKGIQKLIFVIGILIWTICFFVLCALPFAMVEHYVPEFIDYVTYSAIPLLLASKFAGSRAWKNVPKQA
jgi:hypothetical protein